MSNDRADAMRDFLQNAGWSDAAITSLSGDASTRRYHRVALRGQSAMLMDQPHLAETPPCPLGATPEQRRALGYNAEARLAGGDAGRFIAVANYLRSQGLRAPEIYAADPKNGFALLEDLGDDLYVDVLTRGANEPELYGAAADVLAKLHERNAPAALTQGWPLFPYDETAQLAEIDLMTEWFMPLASGRATSGDDVEEHRALWRDALANTRLHAPVLVHRDYHAQNLLWLAGDGHARVGILDFQDAVAGSRAQDLMHLLEDARRDVSRETRETTLNRYLAHARVYGAPLDEEEFGAEMAVAAAQRNARIVGIFARLYKRDGKPRYLQYLPRVWGHLNGDLEHPSLAPLRAWYDRMLPMELRAIPRIASAA